MPRYVVDIHNTSNKAASANFQVGNIDLCNNFAPRSASKGKVKTFKNIRSRLSDSKRAIVTLEEGHSIDVTTGL